MTECLGYLFNRYGYTSHGAGGRYNARGLECHSHERCHDRFFIERVDNKEISDLKPVMFFFYDLTFQV